MRPVERGDVPRDYSEYNAALGDLEKRLGLYCSYCECHVSSGLAVEHKLPKEHRKDLELTWNNFLLGCNICNPIKGETVMNENDSLWPDINNTLMAVRYADGGFVTVAEGLSTALRIKAQSLIDLVGLDRHEAKCWPSPSKRDKRWSMREKVWKSAELCRSNFEDLGGAKQARDIVVEAARGQGFFSVWMTVFGDHPPVRKALIDAFPGTDETCFDSNGSPVRKPGKEI